MNCERGLSTFDYKMRWTDSLLYTLPFGKGRTYLANAGRAVDILVGGWQAGTIFTWEGGLPDNVTCNNATGVQNNSNTCYPDATGIKPNSGPGVGSPSGFWNPAAFVDRLPGGAAYRYGNSGRDTLIGPGLVDWDFSMLKNIAITERQSLQLRGEMYNVANHPGFRTAGQPEGLGDLRRHRRPDHHQFAAVPGRFEEHISGVASDLRICRSGASHCVRDEVRHARSGRRTAKGISAAQLLVAGSLLWSSSCNGAGTAS